MLHGIAVHLRGRRLQNPRVDSLGQAEHIQCPHHVCLDRLHRVVLVMNRRRGTREVIYLIDFEQDRFDHVVTQQLESVIVEQLQDVFATASEKIVEADDLVTISN